MSATSGSTTKLVDLTCTILDDRRERSVLVREHQTGKTVSLPLSLIEVAPIDGGLHHIITMPEWLAIDRELV